MKYTQPILDREARRTDQETAREGLAGWTTNRVYRLPGDQHGHDRGLAGAGRELERKAHQIGVGIAIGERQQVQEALSVFRLRRDLCQPDCCLNRFDVAEKRANATEIVVPPMLKQTRCLWRYLPMLRVWQVAPRLDVATHLVDDRGWIVLLLRRREPFAVFEYEAFLRCGFFAFLGLWDRGDEFGATAVLVNLLRRLSIVIKLPMPPWRFIRGVKNGVIKEGIGHD